MASAILGKNCKLYRNTGTWGSPTWVEVENVKDLTLNLAYQEADVSTRAGGGVSRAEPTLLDVSLEFDQVRDTDDADQTAILTAFFAGTLIDMAVSEAAIATAGTKYYRQEWKVLSGPQAEALADAKRISFTLKPCFSSNNGGWTTAS